MKQQDIKIRPEDGIERYGSYWRPDGEVKGGVALVHGLGEHVHRYEHVAAAFCAAGYALFGFDHPGHGRSKGSRGHVPHYEMLLNETARSLERLREAHPDVPLFLYGHSWGGNIGLNYLIRRGGVAGAIITGPWLKLPKPPTVIKVALAKVMNRIIPSFAENNQLNADDLSRDPQVGKDYLNDPLVHGKISARTFLESTAAAEYALEHARKVRVPLMLWHGGADKITSPQGSRAFAEKTDTRLDFRILKDHRHEIHNETDKEETIEAMVAWLDSILEPEDVTTP